MDLQGRVSVLRISLTAQAKTRSFLSPRMLKQELLLLANRSLTQDLKRGVNSKGEARPPRARPWAEKWGPYFPHSAKSAHIYLFDAAGRWNHSDQDITDLLRFRTNNVPELYNNNNEGMGGRLIRCPAFTLGNSACGSFLSPSHILSTRHLRPGLFSSISKALASRHQLGMAKIAELVVPSLSPSTTTVLMGDQMTARGLVQPFAPGSDLQRVLSTVRLHNIKPDLLLHVSKPQGNSLVLLELTYARDEILILEEATFEHTPWPTLFEEFDSATAHLAQAPLLDPYRYWNNDGFLKPGATPPNIEGKAPLAYSPRARYQNRTRPARTALRASLGLHVNMVIIEVGVQGFIPRQTTRAINSFLKPLMSSAVSTKSLQCHLIATAHDTVKKVARILRARQQAQ